VKVPRDLVHATLILVFGLTNQVVRKRIVRASRGLAVPVTFTALLFATGCGGGSSPPLAFDSVPPTTSTTAPLTTDPSGSPATDAVQLGPWVDVTANLAGMASECGNMSYVGANPGGDQVIAGVALQGLWANDAASGQWTKLGGGVTNRTAALVFDPEVTDRFWESGSYAGPGAFRTTDGGRTLQGLGAITHLDGLSVDLTDPNRQTMLAGSHERGDLFRSTDGGASWTNLGPRLPADIGFTSQPLVLDTQRHLLGTFHSEKSGIFLTTDGGATWQQVADNGVAGPPLVASDGSIYWPLENSAGLVRSTDSGATWKLVTGGGVLHSYNVVELADGRLASVSQSHLIVSDDQGATWRGVGPELPASGAYGLTYSAVRNAIYVWQWDCGTVVPPGSVQRLDLTPPAG